MIVVSPTDAVGATNQFFLPWGKRAPRGHALLAQTVREIIHRGAQAVVKPLVDVAEVVGELRASFGISEQQLDGSRSVAAGLVVFANRLAGLAEFQLRLAARRIERLDHALAVALKRRAIACRRTNPCLEEIAIGGRGIVQVFEQQKQCLGLQALEVLADGCPGGFCDLLCRHGEIQSAPMIQRFFCS